tara:strand:+ start:37 stop:405 length:369 start_codon:yes stop_codon:yes gene_type:complete
MKGETMTTYNEIMVTSEFGDCDYYAFAHQTEDAEALISSECRTDFRGVAWSTLDVREELEWLAQHFGLNWCPVDETWIGTPPLLTDLHALIHGAEGTTYGIEVYNAEVLMELCRQLLAAETT